MREQVYILDPVHMGPDPYGHQIKTSMTFKFVIILHNLIKAYHRKSGKSKYDRKLTELDVEATRIRSRVNGVLVEQFSHTYYHYVFFLMIMRIVVGVS